MKTFQQFSAELVISEEDYDRMKDSRMERGGVDGNTRYPLKSSGGSGKKVSDDEVRARQKKALDMVRASVIAKHGAGALLFNKKNESYVPGKPAEKLGAVTAIPKDEREAALERIKAKTAAKRKGMKEENVKESGDWWHPDPEQDKKLPGKGPQMRAREDRGQSTSAQTKPDYSNRLKPGETYMQYAKRKQAER